MASADSKADWSKLFSGPNADVWMHVRCRKEMQDLEQKDRVKIEACMEMMYCALEKPESIPFEKFNRNEGRYAAKGQHTETRVQAFKNHQGRVYGVEGSVRGKRTFFAALAFVKKTQKADQEVLKRAVERVQTIRGTIPGASI
jgi:hypothetical protein